MIAARLKLPLLLGYLVAGMAVGPFMPGFVADQSLAGQLSEIGVSLLMFGVGLHFSIKDLLAVRKIAIPGAVAQIVVATLMGAVLGRMWGWNWGAGIVFGLSLSVASTVVLLRALGERRQLETVNGKIAVGWLIVEDLATVLALVALPVFAVKEGAGNEGSPAMTILLTFGKVAAFVLVMLVAGKQLIPRLLGRAARTGLRELFTLGVLALALGIAFGSAALFGVSPALGAFFAGVVIAESDLSHHAGAETLPFQEVFAVLFFVAVGMLFDPSILVDEPLMVVATLFTIMVGKSLASAAIVLLFRYPVGTALTISASLAQIGEFSFILIAMAVNLGLVPPMALSVIVAAAILSIALNPIIFTTVEPIDRWLRQRVRILDVLERKARIEEVVGERSGHLDLHDHVVMIGYGRVGKTVGQALTQHGIPYAVVELDRMVIDALRREGVPAVFGDATRPGILGHAALASARLLIVATPGRSQAREIVEHARKIKPDIEVCIRTHSFPDWQYFESLGIRRIVMGEHELALQMSLNALEALGIEEETAEETVDGLRRSEAFVPID